MGAHLRPQSYGEEKVRTTNTFFVAVKTVVVSKIP